MPSCPRCPARHNPAILTFLSYPNAKPGSPRGDPLVLLSGRSYSPWSRAVPAARASSRRNSTRSASLGHPGKTAVNLPLDVGINRPGRVGGADVIGALVPGALAAHQKTCLRQLGHRLGNHAFIQGKTLGDFLLGQGAEVADDEDDQRLGGGQPAAGTAVAEPDVRAAVQYRNGFEGTVHGKGHRAHLLCGVHYTVFWWQLQRVLTNGGIRAILKWWQLPPYLSVTAKKESCILWKSPKKSGTEGSSFSF